MGIEDFINRDSILSARDRFIKSYCKERGWDLKDLTLSQVMDIRKQEGWKNPNTKDIRV